MLEASANRVEYQLNAIRRKYDLKEDDQKVRYVHEAAELISTLGSPIQREIYGGRVAENAGISAEAMKMEIGKAYKNRIQREKKAQEKVDLAPARSLQPKTGTIRYDNMKSAMAEEGAIALALQDSSLMDKAKNLTGQAFSVPVLGKVYDQLLGMHQKGMEVTLAAVTDLSAEEMSHVVGICQRREGTVNEEAFSDCVRTILQSSQSGSVSTDDDLLAFRDKLKESKGTRK